MKIGLRVSMLLLLLTPLATVAGALTKQDKKTIKSSFKGTIYLRMDAPCATGRHAYGTYKRPLIEVSPEGTTTDADVNTMMTASWWHADSTYWGIRVNDPVELDEVDIDAGDAEVEVELDGVGPADGNSTVIKFVGIHTLDDFKKAYEKAFSSIPLQDHHDDWPADVKQAIAERKLVNGMSKRQVFYITGRPQSFEKKEEGGKKVEIWSLRQDRGMKMGYFKAKAGESTGFPASIRFEDGKLVDAAQAGTSSDFSLDE